MKSSTVFILLFIFSINLKAQTTDTLYIDVNGIRLHAVLNQPLLAENPPLAVIIAGSGPTDLNGNNPVMQNNSLKFLSEKLIEQGVATLRFDKRGVGKSNYFDFEEKNLVIEHYAADVEALVRQFRKEGFTDIFIIGHSEGSLIGLLAARNISINGFVSIAGAGSPADEILKKQLQPRLPATFFTQVETIIDSLQQDFQVKNVPPQLNNLFRPSVQPYLISWFNYHPSVLAGKLNCPVLIIQGDKDIQIDKEETQKLANASNSQALIINDMNHVLKTIPGDMQENVASYSDPALPVNTELINAIVKFIKRR